MKRTNKQNNSLHLYFRQLADELNDAGFSVNDGVVIVLDVPFSEGNVKELIARKILEAMQWTDQNGDVITSTAKLNTKQAMELYRIMDNAVCERTGVSVAYPCIDELMTG